MKITDEHFNTLKQMINEVLQVHPYAVSKYENGDFARADKVKDLQKRFCFDLLYGTRKTQSFVCDVLYTYLNDDHIYTALKAICPKVTRKY